MIGRIKGTLEYKKAIDILIDVNGIGYEIQMPMTSIVQLPDIGETVTIHTHLIVREDNHLLFGFMEQNEKDMFRELIKVNGVGARLALNILSTMSPSEFLNVINASDTNSLTKIPKVGKKMAERLLVEMNGRFKDFLIEDKIENNKNDSKKEENAINGMISLGYNSKQAKDMIEAVYDNKLTSEELIREALKKSL